MIIIKTELLMSTMNKKSLEELNLNKKNIVDNILIINQTSKKNTNLYLPNNIRVLNFEEKGLSKSRNRSLKNAKGEICIISDDDNLYLKEYKERILSAYRKYPDADIITFKALSPNGKPIKKYKEKSFRHSLRTLLKVSSWEISFRRKCIIENNIKFDEDFGLGAKYPQGEENIFLVDCYNKGLKIRFVPIEISIHPDELKTGEIFSKKLIKAKGAVFSRIFGLNSMIVNFIFSIKKYSLYKKQGISFFKFLVNIYQGSLDYLLKGENNG